MKYIILESEKKHIYLKHYSTIFKLLNLLVYFQRNCNIPISTNFNSYPQETSWEIIRKLQAYEIKYILNKNCQT